MKSLKNIGQKGQALVEYVLIIALVTGIAVTLIKFFGNSLKDSITKTSCELIGETYKKGDKSGEGTCE